MQSLIELLQATLSKTRIDPASFRSEVEQVQESFRQLERPHSQTAELISLKFRMQQWRSHALALTSGCLETAQGDSAIQAVEILQALELKPAPKVLKRLLETVKSSNDNGLKNAFALYLATLGEPALLSKLAPDASPTLSRLAGPRHKLPILANAPSRCTFEKWSKDPEFSNHLIEESDGVERVRYRGIDFEPGDILIANVNRDGNGVYTFLQNPRSYGFHLGVFAVLEIEGRKVPSVIEGYKLGVRAVPLSTFLSERFNSYLEVCRFRNAPKGFHAAINLQAARMPSLVKGYNFDTEDPSRKFLACTSVATCLYELVGAPTIRTKSRYSEDPQVRRNMEIFEFGVDRFLSLSDFITDPALRIVGAVDNGHFHRNLARDLCERRFFEIFRSGTLDISRFPWLYHVNLFGVRTIRSGSLLGRLLGLPYGLNSRNMPLGPEKVLAIIEVYEHLVARAARKADAFIQARWDQTQLVSVDELAANPEISAKIDRMLASIARAYVPAAESALTLGRA